MKIAFSSPRQSEPRPRAPADQPSACSRTVRGLVAAVLVAPAIAGAIDSDRLAANELCVVCTGPAATYRCKPEGSRIDAMRTQLKCVADIAKSGQHETCTLRRAAEGPCDGPERGVDVGPAAGGGAGATAAPAPVPGAVPGKAKSEAAAPPPVVIGREIPQKSTAPATVEELAERTAANSKQQLKKAGETVSEAARQTGGAVQDAAKKSWKCVTSLFSDC